VARLFVDQVVKGILSLYGHIALGARRLRCGDPVDDLNASQGFIPKGRALVYVAARRSPRIRSYHAPLLEAGVGSASLRPAHSSAIDWDAVVSDDGLRDLTSPRTESGGGSSISGRQAESDKDDFNARSVIPSPTNLTRTSDGMASPDQCRLFQHTRTAAPTSSCEAAPR